MSKIITLKDNITGETIYPTIPHKLVTDFRGSNICGIFDYHSQLLNDNITIHGVDTIKNCNNSIKNLKGLETDSSIKNLSKCITENSIVTTSVNLLNSDKDIEELDLNNYINKDEDFYNTEEITNLVENTIKSYSYIQENAPQYSPVGKEIRVTEDAIYIGINGIWYKIDINNVDDFSIDGSTLRISNQNTTITENTLNINNPSSTIIDTKLKLN